MAYCDTSLIFSVLHRSVQSVFMSQTSSLPGHQCCEHIHSICKPVSG